MKHNNLKNNKKAQAHLEVILATVIFIGFIFVLLYIIKPFETKGANNNADILITTIPKYLEANVSEIGIKVDDSRITSCFSIAMGLGKIKTYKITGSSEELTDSLGTNNNIVIKGTSGFYNVYSSEEFEDITTMSTSCTATTNYQLASSRKISVLSNKKILELNKTYYDDYQKTKEILGIPTSSDYGIIIIDDSGKEIIKALNLPKSQINVNVKETSERIIYSDGTIKNARLRVYSY